MALVNLADSDGKWFKSCYGPEARQTDSKVVFCAHTLLADTVLVVEDTKQDARFCDNPQVTGPPYLRFYAGAPLITQDNLRLGTLCVIDYQPRSFSAEQQAMLANLAAIVMEEIELRVTTPSLHVQPEDLQRVETELQEATNFTERLLASISSILIGIDKAGSITLWNTRAEMIFGLPAPVVLGKRLTACHLTWDWEQIERGIETCRRIGQSMRVDNIPYEDEKGNLRLLGISLHPIQGPDTEPQGFLLVGADITEREHAEEELMRSRTELQVLFDLIPAMVWFKDTNNNILRVNKQVADAAGKLVEEIEGKDCRDIYPKEADQYYADDLEVIRSASPKLGIIEKLRSPEGKEIWVQTDKVPYCDKNGHVIGIVVAALDITERKQAEDALARAVEELERRNWELAEARDAALAAGRVKSEFLANTSHEIRTPLNGVIGMAEVLSNTTLDTNQKTYLRTLRQSAQGLLGIINDILDFSKIEAGKLSLEKIDFSLREVIEDTAALLSPKAHEKGLEVCCLLPPLGTHAACAANQLQGDPTRLRQVITNLFANAIKFTQAQGEITFGAQLLSESPTEARWRLFVRDTGIGIPTERQSAIFESFTQADGSTTRQFGGTGLGLTICRQLVSLMGGQIQLRSEVGKGSEFQVDLTLLKQATSDPAMVQEARLFSNLFVLLVGDTPSCHALSDLLCAWGCSVDTAHDAEQALKQLSGRTQQGKSVDLVVLGMPMQQTDARALVQRIRALSTSGEVSGLAKVPVALLCAIGAPGAVEMMSDPSFTTCLCKPVRQIDLWTVLMQLRGAPQNIDPLSRPGRQDALASGAGVVVIPTYSARILLAEDVAVNQMVARELLKQCGVSAELLKFVETGGEAVRAWETGAFDLILMDVQMPQMDGWEATQTIRAREQERGSGHIPIIAMTGHASSDDREKCLFVGMDGYLTKPLDGKMLSAALEPWLLDFREDRSPHGNDISGRDPDAEEFPSGPPILNRSRLSAVTGGDRSIEEAILREFLQSVPRMLVCCELAVEMGEGVGLEHWAHTLKGSSRTIGADALGALCEELEELGKQDQADAGGPLLVRLQQEWSRVNAHIKRLLQEER